MAAKKRSAAQELASLKRDDAAFSALCGSLATDSAKAAAGMGRTDEALAWLDEALRAGRIKKGQTILFDAFGAGLTAGAVLLRW